MTCHFETISNNQQFIVKLQIFYSAVLEKLISLCYLTSPISTLGEVAVDIVFLNGLDSL